MAKPKGSRFRDELSEAMKALRGQGCWRHCFDDVGAQFHKCPRCFQPVHASSSKRPADLAAVYHGHGVILEAKETVAPRISWDRLEDHQQRSLDAVEAAGGTALVAIRWGIEGAPRVFVVSWRDWEALQASSGRKSLPLDDLQRPGPPICWELARARVLDNPGQGIPNPLVWDLRPVLDFYLRRHLRALSGQPDLEANCA